MALSASAITLMQIIDAIVLSRHSSEAVAAIGAAGMALVLFQGFLAGTAGYTGVFVAHSHGQGDAHGVRASAWLGLHVSLFSGVLAFAVAWPLSRLFLLIGHQPLVAEYESAYFWICMAGSFFPVLSAAMSGWLSGIGRPAVVMTVNFFSLAVNATLAWGLVQGEWGLPRLGIAGAAFATVTAQALTAFLLLSLFFRWGGFSNAVARKFDWPKISHFLSLATPMGLRISGELAAWTLFLIIIGRLGTVELAASSIAFRINGLAFFPALGLGQAAGILVGHARGAGRDDDVSAICWQSFAVCEIWMLLMALLYVIAPEQLMTIFAGDGPDSGLIIIEGVLILKFVAFYCVFDSANIIIGCVLAAAGDTRWVARAFIISSTVFLILLWLVGCFMPGLLTEWSLATFFVFATALIWMFRFRSGAWRKAAVLRDKPVFS